MDWIKSELFWLSDQYNYLVVKIYDKSWVFSDESAQPKTRCCRNLRRRERQKERWRQKARGSGVTVFCIGVGGGGRNRLCRKPLPEEVCFNADSVPVEAIMLIWPPRYTVKNVRSGREEMHHENLQLRPAEREREMEDTVQRKHTGSKHGMFFIPPVPTGLHSYPTLTRLRGVTSCFQSGLHPPPHHLHSHTHTHTFQHHTRFYSWMKSINGSSERVARQWTRPARQPRISWLMLQKKNLSDPSGCTIKNEILVCTPKKSMLGNLTI